MTTITISLADLRALIAMRSVIADAAHHPEAAAAPLDKESLTPWDAGSVYS